MRPMYDMPQRHNDNDLLQFIVGLTCVLLIVLVVFGIINLLTKRAEKTAAGKPAPGEDPIAIVKARYAKGEITKEQFEQFKKDLK